MYVDIAKVGVEGSSKSVRARSGVSSYNRAWATMRASKESLVVRVDG